MVLGLLLPEITRKPGWMARSASTQVLAWGWLWMPMLVVLAVITLKPGC